MIVPESTSKLLPFALSDLRAAIPAHCFNRIAWRSFGTLVFDLLEACLAAGVMLHWHFALEDSWIVYIIWPLYWFYQGATMMGIWVVAHECGHGAFSEYQKLNDVIGLVFHSMLYVPYHSWQISHAKHHHYTNNMQKDEPFIPDRAPAAIEGSLTFMQTLYRVVAYLTLGFPLYLLINASGPIRPQRFSHLNPSAPIFKPSQRLKVIASDIGLALWTAVLVALTWRFGAVVLLLYVPSLAITNMFLTSITYLQHTHPDVPHYENSEWTFLRGALSTVDRTMGFWLNHKVHHLVDTHVLHHIFPQIPHYHAEEASEHLQRVLGDYYKRDESNFAVSFWKAIRDCTAVSGQGVLHWVVRTVGKEE
eukprot:TRINITY_DN14086_c0_g1_i1.p1 TRINITY_DN14086_c0_g1~~TRINITY_DN14086_c0_g1_i1.p1  ORF type:complete len:363 (+),score=48.57 TRINITY_DN14086_c0_g1_i1:59-1147(+)